MCSSPSQSRAYSMKSVELRQPRLARAVVQDLEAARARDVVHVAAADLGVRLAVAVVERERFRRGRDRAVDDLGREQHAAVRRPSAGPRRAGAGASSRPRMSMPVSAMMRFASARMEAIRSGSSI